MTVELIMPKLGESITEATILQWTKKIGDTFGKDDTLLEVSTDKVDSDVPAPCAGKLIEINYQDGDVVPIGAVLAILESDDTVVPASPSDIKQNAQKKQEPVSQSPVQSASAAPITNVYHKGDIFLSPLVLSIAKEHSLSMDELRTIPGTGAEGRIRKSDIKQYLQNRKYPLPLHGLQGAIQHASTPASNYTPPPIHLGENDRIVEMDRMRQMIADHMVYSKHTSPHVTAYVEVDLTHIVSWRKLIKEDFFEEFGQKLTYTPLFISAISNAIKKYPMINSAMKGNNEVVIRGDINIGMATALPTGNLIVPVIKNASQKDIVELSSDVNSLANKARTNSLKPEDIQGGTFTLSNVGTFGSLTGTPIINQPQAAILATGIIKKRAEVIERDGDHQIEIRDMMILALSFDHRIVDGYLGGSFLKCVADELEAFDTTQTFIK